MTDPYRPGNAEPTQPRPDTADPAWAGQLPPQTGGYPPPTSPDPTTGWAAPTVEPPSGGGDGGGRSEPPKSPKWLWMVAGGAVLLVIGLVIALLIANGSKQTSTTVAPVPTITSANTPSSRHPAPTRSPSTSDTPTTTSGPSTTSATDPNNTSAVLYNVTGTGQAVSITYLGTGGAMKTEVNVELPWSAEVMMPPSAATAASVTVVTLGNRATCTLTLDGTQVREYTGSVLTICSASHQ